MVSTLYNINIMLAKEFGLSNIEVLNNMTWDEYDIYVAKLLEAKKEE